MTAPRRHRMGAAEWFSLSAIVFAVGGSLMNASMKWSGATSQMEYQERRISSLESWQEKTRDQLEMMNRKLDLVIAKLGEKGFPNVENH